MIKNYLKLGYHYFEDFFIAPYGFEKIKVIILLTIVIALNLSVNQTTGIFIVDLITRAVFSLFLAFLTWCYYILFKRAILNDKFPITIAIVLIVLSLPLIFMWVITIIEHNNDFKVADLTMKEWPTVFAGVLTYYGTTILGLLTLFRKDPVSSDVSNNLKYPQLKANNLSIFKHINKKRFTPKKHTLQTVLECYEDCNRYIVIKNKLENISKTSIRSVIIKSFACNLFFEHTVCMHYLKFTPARIENILVNSGFNIEICIEVPDNLKIEDLFALDIYFCLEYQDTCLQCNSQSFHIKTNVCDVPLSSLLIIECLVD